MLKVEILDLSGQNFEILIPDKSNTHFIKNVLKDKFNYDVKDCEIFHDNIEISDKKSITKDFIKNNNKFLIYKSKSVHKRNFPKSFPIMKNDRYQDFFISGNIQRNEEFSYQFLNDNPETHLMFTNNSQPYDQHHSFQPNTASLNQRYHNFQTLDNNIYNSYSNNNINESSDSDVFNNVDFHQPQSTLYIRNIRLLNQPNHSFGNNIENNDNRNNDMRRSIRHHIMNYENDNLNLYPNNYRESSNYWISGSQNPTVSHNYSYRYWSNISYNSPSNSENNEENLESENEEVVNNDGNGFDQEILNFEVDNYAVHDLEPEHRYYESRNNMVDTHSETTAMMRRILNRLIERANHDNIFEDMISTSFDSDNEEEDDEDDDLYNELESINDFMMNFDNENDIDEEEDSEEEDSENNSEEDEEEDFANSDEENEDDEAIALSLFPGIEFAQNDRDSINRIVHFGYDRATVIQVYIACGRNEENTIECLMSMMQ